jgi:DNA invertase Pin-like site-specific DNA recombinase
VNSITLKQSSSTKSEPSKLVAIYGRVSTNQQTVENQLLDLQKVATRNNWEVVGVYTDEGISGKHGRDKRPQFDELMKDATRKKFDLIMSWDVSRLGRSLKHLVEFMEDIQSKNIDLYLHANGLDSSTPSGRAMFGMLSVFSSFEREMISERVKSGLERAKANGKKLGRPSNMNDGLRSSIRLLRERGLGIKKIARELGVGVCTVYKALETPA